MREDTRTRQLREASNPFFSDRKLRLGTFSTNLSGGSRSRASTACWKRIGETLTLAQLADAMQFEALVPVGRWKGFAASPTSTERSSNPFPGRLESARPPDIRGCSRPRTSRPFIRSWPRNRPPRSITSPVDVSASTSSPAGISRRSKCLASRRWSTTPATTARWNGSTSSSGFGRPRRNSTTRPILQGGQGLVHAQADPAALPGGDERRRVGAGTSLCGEVLRRGVPQSRLERCRLHPQADRGLQGSGAQGIRPRI